MACGNRPLYRGGLRAWGLDARPPVDDGEAARRRMKPVMRCKGFPFDAVNRVACLEWISADFGQTNRRCATHGRLSLNETLSAKEDKMQRECRGKLLGCSMGLCP